jgi:hypothetical protein
MTSPSLAGRVVALSMSPSNDLGRLGYPPREFEQLAFTLALRIVRAGGRIGYGGHLQPGSMLVDMVEHLAATYCTAELRAGEEKPLLHLLAQSELASTRFAQLAPALAGIRLFADTRVPLVDGQYLALSARRDLEADDGAGAVLKVKRGDGAVEVVRSQQELEALAASLPVATVPQALQTMREAQAQVAAARVVIGGRRGDLGVAANKDVFGGAMPGIYEETLIALDAGRPVVLLAAYGGATRDVAADLGLIPEERRTPMLGPTQEGVAEARRRMRERRDGLPRDQLAALAGFAARDDSETLARDVVDWIAQRAAEWPG